MDPSGIYNKCNMYAMLKNIPQPSKFQDIGHSKQLLV